MSRNREKKREWVEKLTGLIKYGLAGGICTVVNLLLFWLLEKAGFHYILANMLSYFAAVMLNYLMNLKFVFVRKNAERQDGKRQGGGMFRFLLVRGANLLVDNGAFYFSVSVMEMPVYCSRFALTFLEMLVTYGLMKTIVFREQVEQ